MKAPKNKKKNNKNKRKRPQHSHTQRRAAAHIAAAPPAMHTYLPPPSKAKTTQKHVAHLTMAFVIIAIVCTWFAQNGINAYWQQHYHRASPIQNWSNNPIWRSGATLQNWLAQHLSPDGTFAAHSLPIETTDETTTPTSPTHHADEPIDPPTIDAADATPPNPNAADDPEIHLTDGDMVLFTGDSMMEGIAPHLQRRLQREYGIASLNISKQSTGLAYPKMFDWPATIEQHLAQYPRIKAVAVFLGPNDPWDFPNPQGGTGYLKFQSPEWESVYRSRIRRIADAVEAHNARLIWLEIPPMRGAKLHSQMAYLNRIMADELRGRAHWLPTVQATGGHSDGSFGENLQHNGQTVRVRSKDGIHFTLKGQHILAEHLGKHFVYRPQP